jgi:hypothetical protein
MSENTPQTERVHPEDPAEGADDAPETATAEGDVARVHPQEPAEGSDDSSVTE